MGSLIHLLQSIVFLGGVACYVIVLVKMFQSGNSGTGVLTLVLTLLCGIGGIIAFIWGWSNSARYNLQQVMLAWTVLIAVGLALTGAALTQGVSLVPRPF